MIVARSLLAAGVAVLLGLGAPPMAATAVTLAAPEEVPAGPADGPKFTPPAEDAIPNSPLGDMVRLGRDIFVDTQTHAKGYIGNGLNCVNCHLDAGRLANSSPLWAAYVAYPAFRTKDNKVNSYAERLEGCFRFSMNGRMPPPDSDIVVALISYSFWLATGAPTGAQLAGRGYPEVAKPPLAPSVQRGSLVYGERCALCHGAAGQGTKVAGNYAFPPLWGMDSYNQGAGMHRVNTAAAFVKANMPLGQGNSLSDQQSWDVAAFVNSHARPPDPRRVSATAAKAPAP
jgi:thiosulfate dehydrogenase